MARAAEEVFSRMAENPFEQGEFYFSESQRQLVAIDEMPLPYAKNVMVKLLQNEGKAFAGSQMHLALYARLRPSKFQLRETLASQGEASIWSPQTGTSAENLRMEYQARRRMYAAGRLLHRKVETHRDGDFIKGFCEPVEVGIRIRRVK